MEPCPVAGDVERSRPARHRLIDGASTGNEYLNGGGLTLVAGHVE